MLGDLVFGPWRVHVSDNGTLSARSYFESAFADYQLYALIIGSALWADYVDFIVDQTREPYPPKPLRVLDPFQVAQQEPGKRTRLIREQMQRFLEIFLSRAVDNLQIYLVDVIREVLKKRPEVLSDHKMELSVSEILAYASLDSMLSAKVETTVQTLAYAGFRKLRDWCTRRGIPLAVRDQDVEDVVEFIATRNVIAHNRGVVNDLYVSLVANPAFAQGDVRHLEKEDLDKCRLLLARVVDESDSAIAAKFSLNTAPIASRLVERATPLNPEEVKGTNECTARVQAGDAPEPPICRAQNG